MFYHLNAVCISAVAVFNFLTFFIVKALLMCIDVFNLRLLIQIWYKS